MGTPTETIANAKAQRLSDRGKTNTPAYLCEFCDKRYAMFYDGVRFVANLLCYSLHLLAISCNEMQTSSFDLKSLDVRVVPVRFRPQAPLKSKTYWPPAIVAFCSSQLTARMAAT